MNKRNLLADLGRAFMDEVGANRVRVNTGYAGTSIRSLREECPLGGEVPV